jgi:hypothetical protein
MSLLDVLTIGTRVSFDLYPASIVGTTFKNAEVASILDFTTAMLFEDVAAMHANVYPTLPPGTLNDPKKYTYIKFILENNKVLIVGLPWIKENTVAVESTTNMLVKVMSVDSVQRVRFVDMCAVNGFTIVVTGQE